MALGFHPHFKASRTYQATPEELATTVQAVLQELGWPCKPISDTEFTATVPTTGWTWSHDFTVKILPGGVLEAQSQSTSNEIGYDFDRNQHYVEVFFARIEQMRQGA